MWFEKLTGFEEENPDQVRNNLTIENEYLVSLVNGMRYKYGALEIPALKDLKLMAPPIEIYKDHIHVSEVIGNAQELHVNPGNEGALFQVASQFNLLEMVDPHVTPESGVGIYGRDYTQGPACAIACGAGTIFRNYFVRLNGQIGQTISNQIDCLDEIGKAFNNEELLLWRMRNGYALANKDGLLSISRKIQELSKNEYEELKEKLKIGLQWNTEVTISHSKHLVTQAYCSALPIAYSDLDSHLWKDFAKLILEATYESTFYAALRNYDRTGNNKLYLTLVGGGAFGNEMNWILEAIEHSVNKFRNTPLDVRIVSFGGSNFRVKSFIKTLNSK